MIYNEVNFMQFMLDLLLVFSLFLQSFDI